VLVAFNPVLPERKAPDFFFVDHVLCFHVVKVARCYRTPESVVALPRLAWPRRTQPNRAPKNCLSYRTQ
jgi:hypothetical protein